MAASAFSAPDQRRVVGAMLGNESPEELWHVMFAPGDVRQVTLDQLDAAYKAGILTDNTQVWQVGMPSWVPLGAIADNDPPAPPTQPRASLGAFPPAAHNPYAQQPSAYPQQPLAGAYPQPHSGYPQPHSAYPQHLSSGAYPQQHAPLPRPAGYGVAASAYPSSFPSPNAYPGSAYPAPAYPAPQLLRETQPPRVDSGFQSLNLAAPSAPAYGPPPTPLELLGAAASSNQGVRLFQIVGGICLLIILVRNDVLRSVANSVGLGSSVRVEEGMAASGSSENRAASASMTGSARSGSESPAADTGSSSSSGPRGISIDSLPRAAGPESRTERRAREREERVREREERVSAAAEQRAERRQKAEEAAAARASRRAEAREAKAAAEPAPSRARERERPAPTPKFAKEAVAEAPKAERAEAPPPRAAEPIPAGEDIRERMRKMFEKKRAEVDAEAKANKPRMRDVEPEPEENTEKAEKTAKTDKAAEKAAKKEKEKEKAEAAKKEKEKAAPAVSNNTKITGNSFLDAAIRDTIRKDSAK